MSFLLRRLRACLDPSAHPYERNVCHWLDEVRGAFGVTGTLLFPAPVVASAWHFLEWTWPVTVALSVACLYFAHRGHWAATFIWADFRLEEWGREIFTGTSRNSNLFPDCTKESYAGAKRGGYKEDDEIMRIFHDGKWTVHLPWEQTGQLRYDWQGPSEWTWAQRFHHRHVRPRLIARGVPGYEART